MPSKKIVPCLILALLAAAPLAHADETVDCVLNRSGGDSLPLANKVYDGESVVSNTNNPLQIRFEASLAKSSFLFVMQDDLKQQRVAFTGAPYSLNWDGARITSPNSELNCRKKSTEPATTIPSVGRADVPYFVCLLDEVQMEKGQPASAKRIVQSVSSAITFRLPLKVKAETEKYAFAVSSFDLDPVNGLSVSLTDKGTGQTATFNGPPKSLVSSFMFGFTQGDREVSAKFLRLGCVFTDDPKNYLEDLSKQP